MRMCDCCEAVVSNFMVAIVFMASSLSSGVVAILDCVMAFFYRISLCLEHAVIFSMISIRLLCVLVCTVRSLGIDLMHGEAFPSLSLENVVRNHESRKPTSWKSSTGCCRPRERRSSSLCSSQCHGYLLSKRTIGRVSAQVESDSPSCEARRLLQNV